MSAIQASAETNYSSRCEQLQTAHVIPHSLGLDICSFQNCTCFSVIDSSTQSLSHLLVNAHAEIQAKQRFSLAMKVHLLTWIHIVDFATKALPPLCNQGLSCWQSGMNKINLSCLRWQVEQLPVSDTPVPTRILEEIKHAKERAQELNDDKARWVGERIRSDLKMTRVRQVSGGAMIAGCLAGALISTAVLAVMPPLGLIGLLGSGTAGLAATPVLKSGEEGSHLEIFKHNYPEQLKPAFYNIGGQKIELTYSIRRKLVEVLCASQDLNLRSEAREWVALRDNFASFIERLGYSTNTDLLKELTYLEHRNILWGERELNTVKDSTV